MDDQARRAEELLEERSRARKPNGHANTAEASTSSESDVATATDENAAALQRMAADFANYRRRNEADRADFAKFAKADLIARLLDVLDAYDRALSTVPDDLKGSSWAEGMWLIERKLRSILEAEGLQAVDSLGTPFDPHLHEAIAHVDSDEPEGTVIREHQKAYRLYDRVIRPAMVTVAKKKES